MTQHFHQERMVFDRFYHPKNHEKAGSADHLA
jgi:hypothetical protein